MNQPAMNRGDASAPGQGTPVRDLPPHGLPDRLVGRPLARMNGIGNAIVVLDLRGSDEVVTEADARALAAAPGLRFDQLMVIHDADEPGTQARLAIHNTDGSASGACGNGTRCVAWWLFRDAPADALIVTTPKARLACRRLGPWRFSVDMGRPRFAPADIPVCASVRSPERSMGADGTFPAEVTLSGLPPASPFRRPFAVGMGNPHAVFFVADVAALDLAAIGPPIERAAEFPERANVSFAQVIDRDTIRLRVWERGAGATLGCGSGACATLVAAAVTGRTARAARIGLPGGTLDGGWGEDDHVVMAGPVELEWSGRLGDRVVLP